MTGLELPSASAAERGVICPPTVALPRVNHVGGAPQERGTALHAFIADVKEIGRERALEKVPKRYRMHAESLPLESLHLERFQHEPAFVYDVEAGKARLLGANIGRHYREHGWIPDREMPGTPDGVGLSPDAVYVVDWKTGAAEVTHPDDNWQMWVNGLAAARYYQRELVIAEIVHLPEAPGRDPWRQRATYDSLKLDMIEDRLREALPRWRAAYEIVAAGKPVHVTAGAHCEYCPCVAACPATGQLVRQFVSWTKADQEKPDVAAMLDPSNARQAYEMLRRMKSVVDLVETGLKSYASENPIQMDGGRVYGLRTVEKEELDPAVVFDVVREYAGEEAARIAVTWEASKAQLERAAREIAAKTPGTTIAETMRGLLKSVRERNGSKTFPQKRYEQFKPKGE